MIYKLAFIAGAALALHPISALADWTQDFEAARAQAEAENKDLLVNFTGSDWCPPCQMLNEEVFSLDAFTGAAEENFVLVKIDFPEDETLISQEVRTQNDALQERFEVQSFPTVFLMDNQARPYARTGYLEGGPQPYLAELEKLRAVRVARDEAFTKADRVVGVERAQLLYAGLSAMEDEIVAVHYGELIREVAELDPEDTTGLQAKAAQHQAIGGLAEAFMSKAMEGDKDGALALIDAYLEEYKPEGQIRQQILLNKLMVLEPPADNDQAIKVLDEVIAIDPESAIGKQAVEIQAAIKES